MLVRAWNQDGHRRDEGGSGLCAYRTRHPAPRTAWARVETPGRHRVGESCSCWGSPMVPSSLLPRHVAGSPGSRDCAQVFAYRPLRCGFVLSTFSPPCVLRWARLSASLTPYNTRKLPEARVTCIPIVEDAGKTNADFWAPPNPQADHIRVSGNGL